MPAYIPDNHENSNAEKLKPYLEKFGVNYADLFEVFDDSTILYYAADSHWTSAGAAKGIDTILSAAEIDSNYSSGPFSIEGIHIGDLYNMLYPAAKGTEGEVVHSDTFSFECLNNPNNGNAITIETSNPKAKGGLFCWRDSFGIEMYPYLAQSFNKATFSRDSKYDLSKIEDGTNLVILEIVERNLPNLLEPSIISEKSTEEISDINNVDNSTLMADAESLIGESVQKMYDIAGKPEASEYAPSCMGSGQDGELSYPGFTVYTYKDNNSEIIVDVEERKEITPSNQNEDSLPIINEDFADASELEALIKEIVREQTTPTMTNQEKLLVLYKYVVNNFNYRRRNFYDFGATGWIEEEAYTMLTTGKGNCYNFASVFCLLAREIGYDATAYSGTMGPDRRPHAWVEIDMDGETKLFDPEDDWTIKIHGELKKYCISLEKAERYKYVHE
jgi:Transglutaminase-like enzymes, putative cysteine proteases